MIHSYTFFKNLEFLLEITRKLNLLIINILHNKLTDRLTMNAQLLNVVWKGDLILLRQTINDINVASTIIY